MIILAKRDKTEIAKNLRKAIDKTIPIISAFPEIMSNLDVPDDEIGEFAELYKEWEPYQKYKKGEIIQHNNNVYRVIANVNKNSNAEPGTQSGNSYFELITSYESSKEVIK